MRRRHKVLLRPQARRQRRARVAGAALLLGAAAAAAWALRRLPPGSLRPESLVARLPAPRALLVERVSVVGAPPAVQGMLEAAVAPYAGRAWRPWTAGRLRRELTAHFPFLKSVSIRRAWLQRQATVQVELRAPIARVTRRERPAGWLDEGGVLFEAPDAAYPPLQAPQVELGDNGEARLPELARLLTAATAQLPAKPARAAYRSREEGWIVTAADGTTLAWGELEWTGAKLGRLKEVLADAQRRFGGGLTADLRYFEDGRILVRPPLAPGGFAPAVARRR